MVFFLRFPMSPTAVADLHYQSVALLSWIMEQASLHSAIAWLTVLGLKVMSLCRDANSFTAVAARVTYCFFPSTEDDTFTPGVVYVKRKRCVSAAGEKPVNFL